MAVSKRSASRKLQLVTKGRARRLSQEQIRKALEQAGLSASQADDAAIYASHRVRNEADKDSPQYWAMRTITLAVVAHLEKQQVPVGNLPDHKFESVVAGLLDEWDDLMPVGTPHRTHRTGGAA